MAAVDKKLHTFDATPYVQGNDVFVVVRDPSGALTTNTVTVTVLFGNVSVAALFTGNVTINSNNSLIVNNMIVSDKSTPISNTDTVTQGKFWFDNNYIYVAVAGNTIKRAALSDF